MMENLIYTYIKEFILKSGEELDWSQSNHENGLMELKIYKRSERTYRILGLLTLCNDTAKIEDVVIDQKLASLAFNPKKKVKLDESNRQTFRWLEEGWIIKEVRFEKDEKTVSSTNFRMGIRLYQHEQLKIKKELDQTYYEFLQIKHYFLSLYTTKSEKPQSFSLQRELALQNLKRVMNSLTKDELCSSDKFPKKWPVGKRLKFIHFISAFCHLSLNKDEFDWKEIGAAYFQRIGGSKEFDSNKQEFIDYLEEWASVPINELGLTSLGQITPVFFAGQLLGKYSTYDWEQVHALTNLSIANEVYQTNATTLWLVENRAILTRMASTKHFLKETNSLIICVDGHLRSAHKMAISQVLTNSEVKQVIIWCDYDLDGLQISKEIYLVVSQHNEITIKWVLPDQQVISDSFQYEQYLNHFLQNNKMEQEQMVGGVEQWKRWIQD